MFFSTVMYKFCVCAGEEAVDNIWEGRGSYVVQSHMLMLQQFLSIIKKRYVYIRRNWKGLFSQILLPALFVCVAMTVALTAPQLQVCC